MSKKLSTMVGLHQIMNWPDIRSTFFRYPAEFTNIEYFSWYEQNLLLLIAISLNFLRIKRFWFMFGCYFGSHLKHFFSSRIFGQISGWMPDNKKGRISGATLHNSN